MPTTLTNGIQLPDKGSVDWYNSMQSNYNLIDTHLGNTDIHVTAEDKANWNSKQGSLSQAQLDAIAQVATNTDDIATLQSGKADASHTHSSSDITDIGDYATKQYVDSSISGLVDSAPNALDTLNELAAALNDDANFASTVTTALSAKANSVDLATVATSGSYDDLTDTPTIPTNTSDLTNDSNFVVSSSLATVATSGDYDDLSNKPSIPTNTSDLNNDSNFVDTSNTAVASGITSAKVTSYDAHIADTDIHVTAADKTKWNNGVTQAYVLRYASTSVTPSSTISYSVLNNTDNIKAGDSVIDSSGQVFLIASVDSANQTVTVSAVLLTLALDANVMHLSGNESASGDKNFEGLLTTNPSSSLWPAISNTSDDITYLGANAIHVEQKGSGKLTDLSGGAWSIAELGLGCFFFRINNGTDIRYKHLGRSEVYRIPMVSGANRFINDATPNQDNTYGLGSSSLRWSTINGLNPGVLSFPDLNNGIDISGYINAGDSDNSYTPLVDGYISVRVNSTNSCALYASQGDVYISSYGNIVDVDLGGFICSLFIPVVKNVACRIVCRRAQTIVSAKFFPCQGNV